MRNILTSAILACAGMAALSTEAPAATVTAGVNDIILGFEATGGQGVALNLEVDLGPASQFLSGTSKTFTAVQIGNIAADLAATYGNTWFSRADLQWSVFGSTGPSAYQGFLSATTFVTKPETTPGLQTTPWPRGSNTTNSTASQDIQSVIAGLNGRTSTANTNFGSLVTASDGNSYTSHVSQSGGTVSFTAYGPTVEGNFGAGTAGSILDLYAVQRASGAAVGTDSQFLGTVKLDNNGNVIFTAVPEPTSTVALMTGVAALGFVRRRRTA